MGLKFSGRIGRGRLGAGIGAVLLASTAMTGVSLLRSTPAGAQSAQTSYSIPGGSLNRVLAEFGRQSGLQIVYVPRSRQENHLPASAAPRRPRRPLRESFKARGSHTRSPIHEPSRSRRRPVALPPARLPPARSRSIRLMWRGYRRVIPAGRKAPTPTQRAGLHSARIRRSGNYRKLSP